MRGSRRTAAAAGQEDMGRTDRARSRVFSSRRGESIADAAVLSLSGRAVGLPCNRPRPRVQGKFIWVGEDKLYIRGVTYGPFGNDGASEYGDVGAAGRDLALMAETGVNAIRTYTVPPPWLLDLAYELGLYVMVGLPWEQHVAFLDDKARPASIEQRVRSGVRACTG